MCGPVGAIVDAYSTGKYLPQAFRARGISCVHVQSRSEVPTRFRKDFDAASFDDNYVHTGSVSETAEWLSARGARFVVPGTEIAVELADELSEQLRLPNSNGTARSRWRRDKGLMAQALLSSGLRAPVYYRATNASAASQWAAHRNIWPVVVKPVDSAGSDNVIFCGGSDEVNDTAGKILGSLNRMGRINNEILVQEYLRGDQYYVNSVSVRGKHYIAEIWSDLTCRINGAGVVSDREDLLPRYGFPQDVIVSYLRDVLDCLGIRWGPAHSELMMTENGPILIETAARPVGTILPGAVSAATGDNHVTLTADCYADPEEFEKRVDSPYELSHHLMMISLICRKSGLVQDATGLSLLQELPSYWGILSKIEPGARIFRTVDISTSPGHVYLMHRSREQIMRDYAKVRDWEFTDRLYHVRPEFIDC